jgi:glucokinase
MFLGIEIGGTKLQVGLGPGDGTIEALDRTWVDPEAGAEGVLEQVRAAIGRLLPEGKAPARRLAAVGVGFGGPVDLATGRVLVSHQVGGWADFPLADWLRETTGCAHVVVRNDADTAALAEARFGAGKGISPILYMNIGSGIGGGLVIDGQPYEGSGRAVLELGHLSVHTPEGLRHLEDIASGWGLAETARRSGDFDFKPITPATLAEAVRRGHQPARLALRRATDAVALALAQATTLVAPRRIILGGGVSLIGEDLWLGPIRQELQRLTFGPLRGTFDLVPCGLGEAVVVHGALGLAADALRNGDTP